MLQEITVMIQINLNKNAVRWKLLDHPEFQSLHDVVDNTVKERTAIGLGVHKSSNIIYLNHQDNYLQMEH